MATIKIVFTSGKDKVLTASEDQALEVAEAQAWLESDIVYIKIDYPGRWQMYNVCARELIPSLNSTLVEETLQQLRRQS